MNPVKCHAMIIGNDDISDNFVLNIYNTDREAEDKLCLLGTKIDRKLNFNPDIDKLCKEGSKDFNALASQH